MESLTYVSIHCLILVFLSCLVITNGEEEEITDLMIKTLKRIEKCDQQTKIGDYLSVHYTGTLASDGTQFDSSYERKEPFGFQLGKNEVIKGWEQGLMNMCIGEKRRLTVPPHLGYGETGAGEKIPGGAALIFEIELVAIEDAPQPNNVFKDMDKDSDGLLSQDEVRAFLTKQMGGAAAMGGNPDMMENMVKQFIELQDKNKDGKLNPKEFAQPTHGKPKDEL